MRSKNLPDFSEDILTVENEMLTRASQVFGKIPTSGKIKITNQS
jgi:hypothetical protein